METNSTTERIAKHNGQCVMRALLHNGAITHNDLLTNFAQSTGEPLEQIQHELKHVLDNGITGGFILKKDNKYTIPGSDALYETDWCKPGEEPGKEPSKIVIDVEGMVIRITTGGAKVSRKRKAEEMDKGDKIATWPPITCPTKKMKRR